MDPFEIEGLRLSADLICHPGPSVGYRIEEDGRVLTYIPDHEPALGARSFPGRPDWISGYALAHGADVLIHDSQYTDEEYLRRVGWGHSSMTQAVQFAMAAEVERLIGFHHDPDRSDDQLDRLCAQLVQQELPFEFRPGWEGATYDV
jgi:ribonuclease BN (tRNA processing enzyme)